MKEDRAMKVKKIWLTDTAVWIQTDDGKEAHEVFADYPRLKYATKEQLTDYQTDEFGIHWNALDEDLCFENFFNRQPTTPLYVLFMSHPELNVSAIAQRMGIPQSLMTQYISGEKQTSEKCLSMIYDTIRAVGQELIAV